jgi:hypothetical protein
MLPHSDMVGKHNISPSPLLKLDAQLQSQNTQSRQPWLVKYSHALQSFADGHQVSAMSLISKLGTGGVNGRLSSITEAVTRSKRSEEKGKATQAQ